MFFIENTQATVLELLENAVRVSFILSGPSLRRTNINPNCIACGPWFLCRGILRKNCV